MSKFWSPRVRSLSPYVPGEQPKLEQLTKLNTNENPYGPSPRVRAAVEAALGDSLRLYPDPNSEALCACIARYYGVSPEQVFVGNGSDEVLGFTFLTFFDQAEPILFPDVTYSFYPVYCNLYGLRYEALPLGPKFELDLGAYRRKNGGIVFANPNAPTSRAVSRAEIAQQLLAHNTDSVVVVDEAYVDFGAESVIPLCREYPNLLVVQTLSKSRSLAGLRVGFAIGDAELIAGLNRVKNSFNSYPLDRLAGAAAIAAFEDEAHYQSTRARVIDSREWLTRELERLGFEVLPSAANFVFARHPAWTGSVLMRELRQRAVIVRHFDKPRISDFLRISVGTDAECQRLVRCLTEILGSSSDRTREQL
ncbi:MAG TPA: histidinol-phosphate transaminase [Polyangiaceae bacterium]|nr:histidinol-phosphate transaminase [Polyangiaceae bacterium]